MATISEQVQEQMKAAMLAKDVARLQGLRMIRAKFIELAKDGKGEVTDERCIEALRQLKKQREDSIAAYVSAKRADLADAERAEMEIIDAFLPQLADEATTLVWVRQAIAASSATGAKELGKAMGALMKAHKADIDSTLAKALLTRELGG